MPTWPWDQRELDLPAETIDWIDARSHWSLEQAFGSATEDWPTIKQLVRLLQKFPPGRWTKGPGGFRYRKPYLGGWAWWEALRRAYDHGVDESSRVAPWPALVRAKGGLPDEVHPPEMGGALDVDLALSMGLSPDQVRACVDPEYDPTDWPKRRKGLIDKAKVSHQIDHDDLPLPGLRNAVARWEEMRHHPHLEWLAAHRRGEDPGLAPSSAGLNWGKVQRTELVASLYHRHVTEEALPYETVLSFLLESPPGVGDVHNGLWSDWRWVRLSYEPRYTSLPTARMPSLQRDPSYPRDVASEEELEF